MPEIVEHQGWLALQGFHKLQECLDLAGMDLMYAVVFAIYRPIRKLQELVGECRRACDADLILIFRDFQHHFPFQFTVGLLCPRIQFHRYLVEGYVRELQVVIRLHADADV